MLRVITVAALCVLFGAETGMTGGWTEQNAGDEEYLNRAWKATKFINDNANNGGPYHMIPIKVVKAKSQVVAGINYELEVLVGESTCKKEDISATELTSANCQLKSNSSRVLFKISLWEKPWENFEQFNVEKIRDVGVDEQI